MPWKQVGSAWQGGAGDVALLSKTSCLVAGGQNGGTFGTFVADASKGTLNQTLSIKAGLSMIYAVAISTTSDTAVAMGPALFGSPISYKSSDRGLTWSPSPEKAKGIIGTVAGSEVRSLGGESFAYVAEFNGFENGTKCDHGQPEGDLRQCSGVLLTHDAGDHWQRVDWHGTDGRGVDAVHGAFPSADVWYIAGGAQYSDADPPRMQALITKTSDGGKTFKTIFNNSKVGAQLYAGVGNMVGVDCSDEQNCYAISACGISACEAPQPTPGKYNKTRGYGSYVHRTTDGGASWSTLHFEYVPRRDGDALAFSDLL